MGKKDGKPCKRCGENDWYKNGSCKKCQKEIVKKHRERNRESDLERKRKYRQENKEKVYQYNKKYRQDNKDIVDGISKRAYQKNKKTILKRSSEWRKSNKEKWNEICKAAKNRRRAVYSEPYDFKEICKRYGNRCLCCGKANVKLTIDHVIPVNKGGMDIESNIQPLCKSCNSKKHTNVIDYR